MAGVDKYCSGCSGRRSSPQNTSHTAGQVTSSKCVWCGAYYCFRLRKGTGYGFHAFLTCMLLLLLLIQCKISLYLGPVQTVRPLRCFVTPRHSPNRFFAKASAPRYKSCSLPINSTTISVEIKAIALIFTLRDMRRLRDCKTVKFSFICNYTISLF